MSGDLAIELPVWAPERFRALAAARLRHDAGLDEGTAFDGDHQLNPDFAASPDAPHLRDAAVLIPVVARRPEATVILTRRTDHLARHAGQVAFPGGKIDPTDGSPAEAALREAAEEIGLDRGLAEVVGYGTPYHAGSGFRIVPVVAMIDPGVALTPEPGEVADIFEVPLAFLMSPDNHRIGTRQLHGRTRYFYEMPWEDRHIWGVTAGIIRRIYERLYL